MDTVTTSRQPQQKVLSATQKGRGPPKPPIGEPTTPVGEPTTPVGKPPVAPMARTLGTPARKCSQRRHLSDFVL